MNFLKKIVGLGPTDTATTGSKSPSDSNAASSHSLVLLPTAKSHLMSRPTPLGRGSSFKVTSCVVTCSPTDLKVKTVSENKLRLDRQLSFDQAAATEHLIRESERAAQTGDAIPELEEDLSRTYADRQCDILLEVISFLHANLKSIAADQQRNCGLLFPNFETGFRSTQRTRDELVECFTERYEEKAAECLKLQEKIQVLLKENENLRDELESAGTELSRKSRHASELSYRIQCLEHQTESLQKALRRRLDQITESTAMRDAEMDAIKVREIVKLRAENRRLAETVAEMTKKQSITLTDSSLSLRGDLRRATDECSCKSPFATLNVPAPGGLKLIVQSQVFLSDMTGNRRERYEERWCRCLSRERFLRSCWHRRRSTPRYPERRPPGSTCLR